MSITYPHPVLHPATLDYRDPSAYKAEVSKDTTAEKSVVKVAHALKQNSLVAALVKNDEATFFCTVSVKGTSFRRTRAATAVVQDEQLTAQQEIEIPKFRTPREAFVLAGVALHGERSVLWNDSFDVDPFYKSNELFFQDHALLAFNGWKRFYPVGALFRIRSDPDIPEGVFRADTKFGDTFRITIYMARKLYDEVESNPDSLARSHVLCASLVKALEELRTIAEKGDSEELEDEENRILDQADGLKAYLKEKDIPTWDDDNFDAVEAASRFKPAKLDFDGEFD